jgi:hypothetical protein
MSDPFYSGGGLLGGFLDTTEVRMSTHRQQAERDIAAYRNNIAVAGVAIADRTRQDPIDVVGQDGQAITLEMRQKLAEAMRRGATDGELDALQKPEPLGKAAQARLPGNRVVQPKKMPEPYGGQFMEEGEYSPGRNALMVHEADDTDVVDSLVRMAVRYLARRVPHARVTHILAGAALLPIARAARPHGSQALVCSPPGWHNSQTVRVCADPALSEAYVDINVR